jgi:hypothetical protein
MTISTLSQGRVRQLFVGSALRGRQDHREEAGEMVGIELMPRELRRRAAAYASRSGTPIEIVRFEPPYSGHQVRV